MQAALKVETTVQPGGRIAICAPDLPEGQSVEVIILLPNGKPPRRSALDILAEAPGGRLFKTAQEVDAYLHQERDAWEQ